MRTLPGARVVWTELDGLLATLRIGWRPFSCAVSATPPDEGRNQNFAFEKDGDGARGNEE